MWRGEFVPAASFTAIARSSFVEIEEQRVNYRIRCPRRNGSRHLSHFPANFAREPAPSCPIGSQFRRGGGSRLGGTYAMRKDNEGTVNVPEIEIWKSRGKCRQFLLVPLYSGGSLQGSGGLWRRGKVQRAGSLMEKKINLRSPIVCRSLRVPQEERNKTRGGGGEEEEGKTLGLKRKRKRRVVRTGFTGNQPSHHLENQSP